MKGMEGCARFLQLLCKFRASLFLQDLQNTCKNYQINPASARDTSLSLHISCTICKNLARQIVQEMYCKMFASKISILYLARRRMQVSCKENVHSLHVTCTKCVRIFSFLARNHAQIARFLQAYCTLWAHAYCTFLARIASSKIIIINT